MSRTLSMSKTSLIVFMASSLLMAGCADNRGFQVKRIKTPLTMDKQLPPGGELPALDQDDSDSLDGQEVAVLTPEKKMKTEETQEVLHQVLENTTISYLEGGQEVQATPEIKQELLKELTDLAAKTNALSRDQQFVRGMSISLIQPVENQKGVEVRASLQLEDRSEDMISQVMLSQVKSELDPKATFSGTTVDANWVRGSTDLQSQTWVLCTGVEADPCPSVTVALKISQGSNVQVSVVKFLRDESGYALDRTSSGNIVSFDEARNGQLEKEQQQEQEEQVQQEQQEQVQEEKEVKEAKEEVKTEKASTPSFREAENKSMEAYAKMKAEQEQAQEKKVTPAETKKASTPSFREAENKSMEALRKMEHQKNMELFRKAEKESMENYRKMKAEQEAKAKKSATQTFREAEVKSMEALRKMEREKNLKTFREAEQESMKKYEQMKAAQKKPSFREAEEQSMKALKDYQYQKKIEKILKDNENAPSQEI